MAQGKNGYFFGTLGDQEYNSDNRIAVIKGDASKSSDVIIIMENEIGGPNNIKNGDKKNEYIEKKENGLTIKYTYENEGKDLKITWDYKKPEVKKVVEKKEKVGDDTTSLNSENSINEVNRNKIEEFVKIAFKEIGVIETDKNGKPDGKGNYTKYGKWYKLDGNAWCAMFVSWCANQANILNTLVPTYALCSDGQKWYIKKQKFQKVYDPKIGDIIFFKEEGGRIFHTGIVVENDLKDKKIYTVEGNSSGQVKMRVYAKDNATISGYGINGSDKYSLGLIHKNNDLKEEKLTVANSR